MTDVPLQLSRTSVDAMVFDFDGVLTDNRVFVFEEGREAVLCSRGDGLGFDKLRAAGMPCFILSTEVNPVVTARGRKLKVPVIQGIDDKGLEIANLCQENGYDPRKVVFVGNDLNDLPAMARVGLPIAVADAHATVKKAARWTLSTPGGAGVVRELVDAFDEL